ncbi:MAG: PaaI family thioesterase [Hyphomonadaceae bacterium]
MNHIELLTAIRDRKAALPPAHIKNLRFDQTIALDSFEQGVARATWTPSEDFSIPGPGGFIFGGYVAAVTDQVAHYCMMTVLDDGRMYSTADLRVSYFRPFTERRYAVEARVVTRTRTQVHVEVTFSNGAGAMAAKATLVQRMLEGRPPSQSA